MVESPHNKPMKFSQLLDNINPNFSLLFDNSFISVGVTVLWRYPLGWIDQWVEEDEERTLKWKEIDCIDRMLHCCIEGG